MKAITRDYLVDIVYRTINKTIALHRRAKKTACHCHSQESATDEEVLNFIYYIPWFDDKLKDFLIGNVKETTIIISQSWELEFLKKTMLWSESFEWLHGNDYFLSEAHMSSIKKDVVYLTLPY
ncbi:MAG: hypothetical protein JST81_03750 [Bacteroidetes bacterium]|jgi:hypothetical protein|nr:hypothetical protein [Bacteroidota bacterium]